MPKCPSKGTPSTLLLTALAPSPLRSPRNGRRDGRRSLGPAQSPAQSPLFWFPGFCPSGSHSPTRSDSRASHEPQQAPNRQSLCPVRGMTTGNQSPRVSVKLNITRTDSQRGEAWRYRSLGACLSPKHQAAGQFLRLS